MIPALAPARVARSEINCASCAGYQACKERVRVYGDRVITRQGDWRGILDSSGRRVGSPLRWCIHEKLRRHAELMRGKDVLEIGCGPLSELTYEFCRAQNIRYTGLEPERLPSRHILPVARSLQTKLFAPIYDLGLTERSRRMRYVRDRFPSPLLRGRLFDVIYASSSLEHWHEDVSDRAASIAAYQADIRACYDQLKSGGVLLVDCPLFVHGNELFVRGDVAALEAIFESAPWASVTYESWRRLHDDLPAYAPAAVMREIRERHGVETDNIWLLNPVCRK